MLRYTLSILDLRRARARGGENAPPWENKSMYIFYIELLTGTQSFFIYSPDTLVTLLMPLLQISLSWRRT